MHCSTLQQLFAHPRRDPEVTHRFPQARGTSAAKERNVTVTQTQCARLIANQATKIETAQIENALCRVESAFYSAACEGRGS